MQLFTLTSKKALITCPSRLPLVVLTTLLLACGCGGQQSPGFSAPDPIRNVDSGPQDKRVGRLMIIGLDGTRSAGVTLANTPSLDAIRADGYADMDALTGDVSLSGPGWSSMLSGVWCDKHKVLDNDATWAQSRFDIYPHFITRLEAERPSAVTFSVSHWAPINDEILCADERNETCGGADRVTNVDSDAEVRDAVVNELENGNPDVVFMQFDDIDHAGHGDPPYITDVGGYCPYTDGDPASSGGVCLAENYNANYLNSIEITDNYIGDIMTALKARPNYADENWLIIASPDHGGAGLIINQHGFSNAQDRRTFYIISGDASAPVADAGQVKIVDIAATALFHLGVAIDPAWGLDGQPVGVAGAPAYEQRSIPSCYDQTGGGGDLRQP